MSEGPSIRILIPTHRRPKLLGRCLESLCSLTDELVDTRLHLIENGDNTSKKIISGFADRLPLSYHHFVPGNKSFALNAVIETIAKECLLIFLDDDVAIRPGTITAFRNAGNHYGPGHFFGGVVYPDYSVPPAPEVMPYLPPGARKVDHSRGEPRRIVNDFTYFLGACWACYASDLMRVGKFNEHFGPGAVSGARGQETELQNRMYAKGCVPVFVRDAAVDHYVSERMITADYACERIFLSSLYNGLEKATPLQTLGMLVKLMASVIHLRLRPGDVGDRYRISKAAGYFRGLVSQ